MTTTVSYSPDLKALYLGAEPAKANRIFICIHGRGADAAGIVALGQALMSAGDAVVAPQADGGSWYPYAFTAPRRANEPHLSQALAQQDALCQALEAAGSSPGRWIWVGFSQGACLALEFAYTAGQRFGGVAAFSGGLIGPVGQTWPAPAPALWAQVPVWLECDANDAHIPASRFLETEAALRAAGAHVHARLLAGHGHGISPDQVKRAQAWLTSLPTTT